MILSFGSKLNSGIGNELSPLPTYTLAAWRRDHVITFFLHFATWYFHVVFNNENENMILEFGIKLNRYSAEYTTLIIFVFSVLNIFNNIRVNNSRGISCPLKLTTRGFRFINGA